MGGNASQAQPDRLFTNEELAAYLKIKPRTLYNWRSHGKGPKHSKLGDGRGAIIIYRESHVKEWLDTHLVDTGE